MQQAASVTASKLSPARIAMLGLLAVFYFAAGALHLTATAKFLPIVPDWVPYPYATVVATGVCELLGAVGLLILGTRKAAGIALAAYAICVFPANIKHAFEGVHVAGLPDSWWYHGPRLIAQPLIVWWSLFASGVVDWPWRR